MFNGERATLWKTVLQCQYCSTMSVVVVGVGEDAIFNQGFPRFIRSIGRLQPLQRFRSRIDSYCEAPFRDRQSVAPLGRLGVLAGWSLSYDSRTGAYALAPAPLTRLEVGFRSHWVNVSDDLFLACLRRLPPATTA